MVRLPPVACLLYRGMYIRARVFSRSPPFYSYNLCYHHVRRQRCSSRASNALFLADVRELLVGRHWQIAHRRGFSLSGCVLPGDVPHSSANTNAHSAHRACLLKIDGPALFFATMSQTPGSWLTHWVQPLYRCRSRVIIAATYPITPFVYCGETQRDVWRHR